MCAYPIFCLLCSCSLLFFMSYLIRRVLAKPRLILDEMCRLYGKFASYIRRVLDKMQTFRINGTFRLK